MPGHAVLVIDSIAGPLVLDLDGHSLRTPTGLLTRYRPRTIYSGDGSVHMPDDSAGQVYPSLDHDENAEGRGPGDA